MIHLITSFYISRINSDLNCERNNELQLCLKYNLENPLIEKIHLFLDDNDALEYIQKLNNPKIHVISVGVKPLYSDLFGYAIYHLQDKICMISNSDIYLHSCDINILSKLYEQNTIFALTRFEHNMSRIQIKRFKGSHDAFIFKSPIDSSIIDKIKHVQHHWGSENIVLYELEEIHMKIYNPCYQIVIVHLHKSNLRENNRHTINYTRSRVCYPSIL